MEETLYSGSEFWDSLLIGMDLGSDQENEEGCWSRCEGFESEEDFNFYLNGNYREWNKE